MSRWKWNKTTHELELIAGLGNGKEFHGTNAAWEQLTIAQKDEYEMIDIFDDFNGMPIDSTPTQNSHNPISSGGVYTSEAAINTQIQTLTNEVNSQKQALSDEVNIRKRLGVHNIFNYDAWKQVAFDKCTGTFENNGVTLTATANDAYTAFRVAVGFYPSSAIIPVKTGDKLIFTWETTETTALGDVYLFPNGDTVGTLPHVNNTVGEIEYNVPSGVTFVTFRVGVTTSGNTIHYKNIQFYLEKAVDDGYYPSAMTNRELTDVAVQTKQALSDVEDNLYGNDSVSVTADGTKSYAQMMASLFALVDMAKVKKTTVFAIVYSSALTAYAQLTLKQSTGLDFMYMGYNGSKTHMNYVIYELSSTGYYATESNGVYTDNSSEIVQSGRKFYVIY